MGEGGSVAERARGSTDWPALEALRRRSLRVRGAVEQLIQGARVEGTAELVV